MIEKQCTLRDSVSVEGVGLHTKQKGIITFNPAPVNYGVKFRRVDLEGQPIIPADADNVVDTSRGTTIACDGVKVCTIEHVLAALRGMGVDNVLIDTDVEEMPIKDGSAASFVEAIRKVGIQEQDAEREYWDVTDNIIYEDPSSDTRIEVEPCESYELDVKIKFNTKVLDEQEVVFSDWSQFSSDIAPCRTFVFLHELEMLVNNNLIKGGDMTNAIVFVNKEVGDDELERLSSFFGLPKIKVTECGILNNLELYFEDEPARHKLLDMIGDLSLIGKPIRGRVKAYKPGHKANTSLAKLIKTMMK